MRKQIQEEITRVEGKYELGYVALSERIYDLLSRIVDLEEAVEKLKSSK